jgi:hypothetical protein
VNEIVRFLPLPAERDLPPASLERQKASLVQSIEADLRAAAQKRPRLRRLRSLLGTFLAALALGSTAVLAAESRPDPPPIVIGAAVVAASAPLAAAVATLPVSVRPAG